MQENLNERLRRAVLGRLESLQFAGVLQLPRVKTAAGVSHGAKVELPTNPASSKESIIAKVATPMQSNTEVKSTESVAKKSTWQPAHPESLFESVDLPASEDGNKLTLEVLQNEVAGCTRCAELARTRKQTVFGVGNPDARLCFLGEAPGADEDRLGEPFVGRAGQLLTKIIEACHLKREDVYILNMIKCRPPGNRNPLPEELANCRSYLERQLDLIQPEFICCLGAVAAQNLLNTTLGIGKLRGKTHHFRGATVVCTYHPAFLLRSPSFKKQTWDDMKLLMRKMGVELD
jgi:uracil-DNA glycosylase